MSEPLGGLKDRTFARATAATAISYPPERRLSAAQLASYLDRRTFAVVGSTRADGRPHAAMSIYIRHDLLAADHGRFGARAEPARHALAHDGYPRGGPP